jgi:hypothetical protein
MVDKQKISTANAKVTMMMVIDGDTRTPIQIAEE